MSGKKKIEEDYRKIENAIEQMTQEELRKIRERIDSTKAESEEIGESVDRGFNENTKKKS